MSEGRYFKANAGGVTKLDDFQAGDGTSPSSKKSGSEAIGAGGLKGGTNSAGGKDDQIEVPPEVIEKAKNGDPDALDWLKALGIGAGTVAGAWGLYKLLKGRNGKTTAGELIAPDATGRHLVPRNPDVIQLNEEIIPRRGRTPVAGYLPGPSGQQIGSGAPPPVSARANPKEVTSGRADRYLTQQPHNPRNLPVTQQGEVDAAYSQKAAQDAKATKDFNNANPGRAAKAARLREHGKILRYLIP